MGSIGNTLLLTVAIVAVQNGIGLLLALGVHARIRSRTLLRVIFFAPVVVSPVMVAFLWKYIYNPAPDGGPERGWASGLDRQDWLGDPSLALWSVAGMVMWQYAGYSMVIFLAGLEGVPAELHEAAMIDGAGTVPALPLRHLAAARPRPDDQHDAVHDRRPQAVRPDLRTTNGGPGYATETLSTVLYKQAFVFGKFGYSTAIALVLALFVAAVSLVQVYYLRSREVTA